MSAVEQDHLSPDLIARYVSGSVDDRECFVVDSHLGECRACLAQVREAERLGALWDRWTAAEHAEAVASLWRRQAGAARFALVLGMLSDRRVHRLQAIGIRARRSRPADAALGDEGSYVHSYAVPLPDAAGSVLLWLSRSQQRFYVRVQPEIAEAEGRIRLRLWEQGEADRLRPVSTAHYVDSPVTLEAKGAGRFLLRVEASVQGRKRVWEFDLASP